MLCGHGLRWRLYDTQYYIYDIFKGAFFFEYIFLYCVFITLGVTQCHIILIKGKHGKKTSQSSHKVRRFIFVVTHPTSHPSAKTIDVKTIDLISHIKVTISFQLYNE